MGVSYTLTYFDKETNVYSTFYYYGTSDNAHKHQLVLGVFNDLKFKDDNGNHYELKIDISPERIYRSRAIMLYVNHEPFTERDYTNLHGSFYKNGEILFHGGFCFTIYNDKQARRKTLDVSIYPEDYSYYMYHGIHTLTADGHPMVTSGTQDSELPNDAIQLIDLNDKSMCIFY